MWKSQFFFAVFGMVVEEDFDFDILVKNVHKSLMHIADSPVFYRAVFPKQEKMTKTHFWGGVWPILSESWKNRNLMKFHMI